MFTIKRLAKPDGAKLKSGIRDGVLVLLVIAFCASFFVGNKPQALASFDLKGATKLFVKQVSSAHLSKAKQALHAKRFSRVLKQTLNEYAKAHNLIILVKGAVLAGPDITPQIERQVALNMGGRHD